MRMYSRLYSTIMMCPLEAGRSSTVSPRWSNPVPRFQSLCNNNQVSHKNMEVTCGTAGHLTHGVWPPPPHNTIIWFSFKVKLMCAICRTLSLVKGVLYRRLLWETSTTAIWRGHEQDSFSQQQSSLHTCYQNWASQATYWRCCVLWWCFWPSPGLDNEYHVLL